MIKNGKERGLNLQVGSFEVLEGNEYDLIILNHVVEHFNNFWQDMAKIEMAMTAKGILYLGLPNANLFSYGVFQNSHNYYFKRSQLDMFMRISGFDKISSGLMYEAQDFFAIYEKADVPNAALLRKEKEKTKSFLKNLGVLK